MGRTVLSGDVITVIVEAIDREIDRLTRAKESLLGLTLGCDEGPFEGDTALVAVPDGQTEPAKRVVRKPAPTQKEKGRRKRRG